MFKKTSEDFKITKLDYPFPIYEMEYTPIHPKEKLIEKLYRNTYFHRWEDMVQEKPGIQSSMKLRSPEIVEIIDTSRQMVQQIQRDWRLLYSDTLESHWIYISGNDNPYAPWHKHHWVAEVDNIEPHWTYVFYAEMPENLEGTDGRLYFRLDHDPSTEYWILPRENTFLVFPSLLDHKPETAQKAAKKRIVMAGNYWFDYGQKIW